MLEVGVGDTGVAEPGGQLGPQVQQLPEKLGLFQRLFHEAVQGLPFHPFQFDRWIPLAVDLDAPLQIDERDREGQPSGLQCGGNVPVAILPAADLA